jgi:Fimbrial assembly protein (PilN)
MAEFDLIPSDYAQNRVLRRRVKWFAAALVAIVCLVAFARLALALVTRFENGEVARLQKEGQISAQAKARADEYRQQKLAAEKRLNELDDLMGRDRVRLFLSATDAAYLNGIWFDAIRYYRGETLPTGSLDALPGGARAGIIVVPKENVPTPGSIAQARGIEQHVELVGHALNHSRVAEFMRALGRQPGIADVRLLDTGLRTYTNAQVVDFKLTLLVDEKARRQP